VKNPGRNKKDDLRMKGEYVMPLIPFSGPLDFETM
jgi:hypothetical protein